MPRLISGKLRLAEARGCPRCDILSRHGRATGPNRCKADKRNRQPRAAYLLQLRPTGINANVVRVRRAELPSIVCHQHRQSSANTKGPSEYRASPRPEKSWFRFVPSKQCSKFIFVTSSISQLQQRHMYMDPYHKSISKSFYGRGETGS